MKKITSKTFKIIIILIIFCKIKPVNALDTSKSSIVMDLDSGRIIYEKNSQEKLLIASVTKILTAVVAIENINDLNKEITVGEEILKMYGTNIYIEVGEKIKIKDLLYGLLLRSGNDAAVALATAASQTNEQFIAMMNQKAKEIGMNNSVFNNPHGLDEDTKNYSTAYDLALLSKYAYKNKIYRKITKTKKHIAETENKTYLWYNRNKLLNNYEYCTGGKNGYTPSAGKTLVTTASKNGLDLTIVTLDDNNEYETHKELYDEHFKKYKKYTIIDKNNFYIDKNFYNGTPYIKESFEYPLTEEELSKIKTEIKIDKTIEPTKEKIIGSITIKLDNDKIGELYIYDNYNKKEDKGIFSKLKSLFT